MMISASSTSSAIRDLFMTVSRTYLNLSCPLRCWILLMEPVERSSIMQTLSPLSKSPSARWDPIKPAPPVNRYFMTAISSIDFARYAESLILHEPARHRRIPETLSCPRACSPHQILFLAACWHPEKFHPSHLKLFLSRQKHLK